MAEQQGNQKGKNRFRKDIIHVESSRVKQKLENKQRDNGKTRFIVLEIVVTSLMAGQANNKSSKAGLHESSEGLSSTTFPNPRVSHPVPARHSQAYEKVQRQSHRGA